MPRVNIRKAEDSEWLAVGEVAVEPLRSKFSPGELVSHVKIQQPGDAERPQLLNFRFPPDVFVGPHGHDEDEIIYVLSGEMHFGAEILRPGSSLSVSGGAIYSFRSGPEGLEILNFRPRYDMTYWTAAELRERRRAKT